MDVIDKTQAVSDEIPQAEENTPRRGKAGLRKRKPEVINSKGSRKTAETVEDDLDESSKSEVRLYLTLAAVPQRSAGCYTFQVERAL